MNQFSISRKPITEGSWHRAAWLRPGAPLARLAAAVAASAAVVGVAGLPGPTALAGASPVLTWTQHATAVHPSTRSDASMAYDAATGTVVLFGGQNIIAAPLGGTWA